MPTEDELVSALKKADAAGNVEDAKKLANALKQSRSSTPQPTSPTPNPKEQGLASKVVSGAGRTAGLTARSVLSAPAKLLEGAVNLAYRTPPLSFVNPAAQALGKEPPLRDTKALTDAIDRIGLPEYPDDFAGRLGESMADGIVLGGGTVGVGQKLATATSPVVSGVGRTLAASPTAQLASEVPASLLGEGTAEITDNPLAIMAASIAGSMMIPSKIPKSEVKPGRARKTELIETELGVEGATTLSQRIGTPEEIAKQFAMSKSSELIKQARESNSKVSGALEDFLNGLKGTGSTVEAGAAGREATTKFQKSLRQQQKDAAGPLYRAAEDAEEVIDVANVENSILGFINDYKPRVDPVDGSVVVDEIHNIARQALAQVRSADGDIRDLHKAKKWMDKKIEKATGDSALSKDEKRILTKMKIELTEAMSEQSELYSKANSVFEAYQRPIDAARDSFIGVLSNSDNLQLTSALNRVFSGEVGEINKLKNAISESDPAAYEAMFKAHMKSKMSKLSEDLVGEGEAGVFPVNMPAVFNKTFGGAAGLNKLAAVAPSPQARKTLKNLSRVFDTASRGRNDQSIATEVKKVDESLVGPMRRLVSKLGGLALVWGSHGLAARDAIQPAKIIPDVGRSKRQKALIDSIFNRKFDDDWEAIFAVEPGSAKWVKSMEQMLGELDRVYGIESGEEDNPLKSIEGKTFNIR